MEDDNNEAFSWDTLIGLANELASLGTTIRDREVASNDATK